MSFIPLIETPHCLPFARATKSKDTDTGQTLDNDATPRFQTFPESKIILKCIRIEVQIAVKLYSQCCNPSNVSYLGIYHDFPSLRRSGGRLTAPTELDPAGARVHHTSIKDLLASPPRVPHACATLGMGTPAPIGWE